MLGNGKHDRFYLLSQTGLPDHAQTVGMFFFILAIGVFVFCLISPLLIGRYTGFDSVVNS